MRLFNLLIAGLGRMLVPYATFAVGQYPTRLYYSINAVDGLIYRLVCLLPSYSRQLITPPYCGSHHGENSNLILRIFDAVFESINPHLNIVGVECFEHLLPLLVG